MNGDPLAFALSLVFLLGVLMLLAGSFPAVRARYPRLFGWGSLLAAGAVVAMFVAALVP